jgi:hypothetical protein
MIMNYKLEKIARLETGVERRKKLIATLTEYFYFLICILPVLGLLYFLFTSDNNVVELIFIVAFLSSVLIIIRCFYLMRKFEKERKMLSTKLYQLLKL